MTTAEIRLAELLCARLCHDMAGPVGAAAAGAELLEDSDGEDAETAALVAASAAGAAARLKFFRAALAPAATGPLATQQLHGLVDGYLATAVSAAAPRLQLEWRVPETLEGRMARLLLNLVLLARDALPRGGIIEVDVTGGPSTRLAVTARGETAALTEEARSVLTEGAAPSGPRGAQAQFARLLAAEAGGCAIQVSAVQSGLSITVDALSRIADD